MNTFPVVIGFELTQIEKNNTVKNAVLECMPLIMANSYE